MKADIPKITTSPRLRAFKNEMETKTACELQDKFQEGDVENSI